MFLVLVNVLSGIIIATIFAAIIIFDGKQSKLELANIKLIILTGILVAVATVLNTVIKAVLNNIIPASIFEAKIGNFALVLIGFFCGGALGILGGISADFLGLLVYSSGTPILYFTLTSVLWCVLPYYLVKIFNKLYQRQWTIYFYLPLTYALNLFLISGVDPIILTYLYNFHKAWWLWYLPRLIKFPIDVTISSILLVASYRIFANSLQLNQKFSHNNQLTTRKIKNKQLDTLSINELN